MGKWYFLACSLCLLYLFWEASCRGQPVSIGFVNTKIAGLSLQSKSNRGMPSWHVSTYFRKDEYLQVNGDIQYFFTPDALKLGNFFTSTYSGIGIRVASFAYQDEEKYWLRIPAGLQWEAKPLHMQLFFEIAGLAGPFPNTAVSFNSSLGVRVLL